jgi:hypothetical protein
VASRARAAGKGARHVFADSHACLASRSRPAQAQAKELLEDFAAGNAVAAAEIAGHYRGADPKRFALSDAQLVLARAYGFRSWPALKAFVDGVTVRRLVEAFCAGDAARVRAMEARRPEIVNLDVALRSRRFARHDAERSRACGALQTDSGAACTAASK